MCVAHLTRSWSICSMREFTHTADQRGARVHGCTLVVRLCSTLSANVPPQSRHFRFDSHSFRCFFLFKRSHRMAFIYIFTSDRRHTAATQRPLPNHWQWPIHNYQQYTDTTTRRIECGCVRLGPQPATHTQPHCIRTCAMAPYRV